MSNNNDVELFNELFGEKRTNTEFESRRAKLRGMTPSERVANAMIHGSKWNCEDVIKPALDAFVDAMGDEYTPRSANGRRSLYSSARALLQEVTEAESVEFVHWACDVMNEKNLDVKDHRSLVWLVPKWKRHKKQTTWEQLQETTIEDVEMIKCDKCGKMILPERREIDCAGH